jgi:hypothetical protein
MREISNVELTLERIPSPEATWDKIGEFALTFDGYKAHGSFKVCAEIANDHRLNTLTNARTCLFFEQRRWRHFGYEPDEEAMEYIRKVIGRIRELASN